MTMRTYWDLTENERAALTREDVTRHIDAELMLKGVLKVAPYVAATVPETSLPVTDYYQIVSSPYSALDLAFRSEADAKAVLNLRPLTIASDYEIGDTRFAKPLDGDYGIKVIRLATYDDVLAAKVTLKEAAAAKRENEARARKFKDDSKAVDDALKGLWDDWHTCVSRGREMGRIAATFGEYVATAGSFPVAAKFLAKVFTVSDIAAAEAWTGVKMTGFADVAVSEGPPVVASPNSHDEIGF